MITYISLLRGINVSGQKKTKMEELKRLYESLGFKNVRTYIQSGNIIFDSSDPNILNLRRQIEQKIKNSFGFDVVVFIRTKKEIQKVVKNTPFIKKGSSKLHVTFLSDTPAKSPIDDINEVKGEYEEFLISGREIYLFCPNGYGRSMLSNNFFEKRFKLSATTRNWKTINKLLKLTQH